VKGAPGPYRVAENSLWLGDEELIKGPLTQLEHFCRVLDYVAPEDPDIAPLLRILIRTTRDCSYAAGPRLLADGTPLRVGTPQKPKDRPVKRRAG
jgi:hypothetical protein